MGGGRGELIAYPIGSCGGASATPEVAEGLLACWDLTRSPICASGRIVVLDPSDLVREMRKCTPPPAGSGPSPPDHPGLWGANPRPSSRRMIAPKTWAFRSTRATPVISARPATAARHRKPPLSMRSKHRPRTARLLTPTEPTEEGLRRQGCTPEGRQSRLTLARSARGQAPGRGGS